MLLESFLVAGKSFAVVCHSSGSLRHVKTPGGKLFVEGRTVTGFTNGEEEEVGLTKVVPCRRRTDEPRCHLFQGQELLRSHRCRWPADRNAQQAGELAAGVRPEHDGGHHAFLRDRHRRWAGRAATRWTAPRGRYVGSRADLLSWGGTGDRVAKSRDRGCKPDHAAFSGVPHLQRPCAASYCRAAAIGSQTARRLARHDGLVRSRDHAAL